MERLKSIIIIALILLFFCCDNGKKIKYSENNNITIIETNNSDVLNEIEDRFRIILVGDFADKIHIKLRYYNNKKMQLLLPPFFHDPATIQKASYFAFTKDIIPNNFMVLLWNASEKGKGEIYFKRIIFKYRSRTKIIEARDFKNNFETSDYLNYDESKQILTVINHERDKFRSAFSPKESLIKELKEFTKGNGFKNKDYALIDSKEYQKLFFGKRIAVKLNLNLKLKDELILFFNTGSSKGFNKRFSTSKIVEAGNLKNITFNLEVPRGDLSNLRFDYGSVEGQEVQINSMIIKSDNKEIIINQNQFSKYFWSPKNWNLIIDKASAKYGTKRYKGKIDSKLIGSQKLIKELENLKTKSLN